MKQYRKLKLFWFCLIFVFSATYLLAQSTNQSYPTPVTTNEINGIIKARDIGDSRVTTYFYTFDGTQGDIFVNIVSKNLNGDVDIFITEGLRPLSKIVVYADSSENETGRVIYLRKPERLILRVEGRTPNDDPAIFKIKFAGSFVAAADTGQQEPELPEVRVSNTSGVRVNSVGTVLEVIPKAKPKPKPAETVAEVPEKKAEKVAEKTDETKADEKPEVEPKKVEVVVSENIPAKSSPAKKPVTSRTRTRKQPAPKKEPVATAENPPETKPEESVAKTDVPPEKKADVSTEVKTENPAETKPEESVAKTDIPPEKKADVSTEAKAENPAETKPDVSTDNKADASADVNASSKKTTSKKTRAVKPAKITEPDPLASIHLVILFKDGRRIEKPMSEVDRFTVDRGILTVVSKDGTIGRYPILEVLKTTIE